MENSLKELEERLIDKSNLEPQKKEGFGDAETVE
jgi:hypothetical protein